MGAIVGPFEGIFSAVADELWSTAGNLLVRTTAAYTAGSGTLTVEGTDRWPSTGRLVVNGEIATYSGKTNTTFTGLLDANGDPGLPVDVPVRAVVMEYGRASTQLDLVRRAFFTHTAEGPDLDTLGRNYGIVRPRGMSDLVFRALLQVMIYLEAQTVYGCEQVLDVLLGAGNYEIYEDPETEARRNKVFVKILTLVTNGLAVGKTFIVGGEGPHASAGLTVTVDNPVTKVYGVYDEADPGRTGTNYALETIPALQTLAAFPTELRHAANVFVPADVGQPVQVDGEYWLVRSFITPKRIELSWRSYADGTLDGANPDRVYVDTGRFPTWVVGHQIEITAANGSNAGTYTIAERIDAFEVRVLGAAFVTETDVTWRLVPDFGTAAGLSGQFLRATWAGNVVTVPTGPLPANVLVDYVHVSSAQLVVDPSEDGIDQSPFYLWDEGALVQYILDLITAAGVEAVLEY